MKRYVINLKRRRDRLENFYKINPFSSIDVFEACDGKKIKEESQEKQNLYNLFQGKLKPGEIGCFVSHLMLWQECIKNSNNLTLIFEDDPILTNEFRKNLMMLFKKVNQ